jgi:5-formyltetrahydrofolate cyclo-ligase
MSMEKLSGSFKAELRAVALQRRDALSPSLRRDYGQIILNRIIAMEQFHQARTVMAYCGFGSEIDTAPLLRAVLESGKTLVLPKINRPAGVLDIYQVDDLETGLLTGVWGIREPNPATCQARTPPDIDMVLVPGVAFDRKGGRIGYGKGYYDKLLAQCRHACKIAGAFEVQVFDSVPMAPHDIPVDALVTETGDSTEPQR